MPHYSIILAALDLSPDSVMVIDRAKRLCEGDWSRLHLVHVAERPVTALGSATGKNHRHGELQVRQEIYPELHQLVEDIALPPDHFHIVFGDPASEITYLADKLGAEVIVSGSHGETAIKRLLGSTASDIIHDAHCDVLTVRIR